MQCIAQECCYCCSRSCFQAWSYGLWSSVVTTLAAYASWYGAPLRMTLVACPCNTLARTQAAAPNHSFRDKNGKDMLRACMADLVAKHGSGEGIMLAIKGPMSFVFPDAMSALYGKPLAYNHPVPAAFCNQQCALNEAMYTGQEGEQAAQMSGAIRSSKDSVLTRLLAFLVTAKATGRLLPQACLCCHVCSVHRSTLPHAACLTGTAPHTCTHADPYATAAPHVAPDCCNLALQARMLPR